MQAATTLLAVIGDEAAETSRRAAGMADNVSWEAIGPLPDDPRRALAQLREGWSRARGRALVYTLVDGDPLSPVVDHWARRLGGEPDELETVIGLAGDLPMPDYYLVDTGLPAPSVHWYLGLLERLRPHRVVPVRMTPSTLVSSLRELRFGPEFPLTSEVAAMAREFVPLPDVAPAG